MSKIKVLVHVSSNVHSSENYSIYDSAMFLFDYLTYAYNLIPGTDIVITTDEYDEFTLHNINPFSENHIVHYISYC